MARCSSARWTPTSTWSTDMPNRSCCRLKRMSKFHERRAEDKMEREAEEYARELYDYYYPQDPGYDSQGYDHFGEKVE